MTVTSELMDISTHNFSPCSWCPRI